MGTALISQTKQTPRDKDLCFTVFVNRSYQGFIPWFLWFAQESYPEAGKIVLCSDDVSPSITSLCDRIIPKESYIIKPKCFRGFRCDKDIVIKSLRWVWNDPDWEKYKWMYVGDIDIMLCKENPSLLQQHVDHCTREKLPYSNGVRRDSRRMTGLHFVECDPWFKAIRKVANNYRKELKRGKIRHGNNEVLLWNIVKKSGLGFPEEKFRPHHGMHLRVWRSRASWSYAGTKRMMASEDYQKYWKFFKSKREDKVFKELMNLRGVGSMVNNMLYAYKKLS